MKVAVLATLSVLVALPAEAGQRPRQNSVSPTCDNDGRCSTLNVTHPHRATHAHQSVSRTMSSMPMATA